jgi:hypothetical protein
MLISTGKELISFAEKQGAIISQHLWETLIDLDKSDKQKEILEEMKTLLIHVNQGSKPDLPFILQTWINKIG